MRARTFIATYLLLLFVLFVIISLVSVYMNFNQINILREQSKRDYQRISANLTRDISVLYGRNVGLPGMNFSQAVETLAHSHSRHYSEHNIYISLTEGTFGQINHNFLSAEISFIRNEQGHFISITGLLPEPLHFYRLDYLLNITESINSMQNIQRAFLVFAIIFSGIAAPALYFILSSIFKPLEVVAETSRKIANEHYHERIFVKGTNELSEMAKDFNRMAEKIENQIRMLEEESFGKQRFIDNFAHEIRTPLTSIYGNAEYMQKALLDEGENIILTQSIMDKTTHMKEIANSLLQLATLRNYVPVKSQINLHRLFEDISQTLYKPFREHNIRFICESDVIILWGQEDLIKSLLVNICFNALKACSPNTGVVSLNAVNENDYIILSVEDNGAGIPKESLAKVTEAFYQVDNSEKRRFGGAGLGLTLCKQIADVHDAQMLIESVEGIGTIVKILFTAS
ncbi:MAG: HAMP domain-containing histidine kinase [Defluviitaleaceae bacterium]|nr:HAMP domain-containing histidine kinase [Defluviitaleaceae bacterium]